MSPDTFIALLLPGAQMSQAAASVPIGVTLAQAALESGWLSRAPGNNIFGIKATPDWKGPTVSFATHEVIHGISTPVTATFRAYPDYAGSLKDHATFLRQNPRYAACFTTGDSKIFAQRLAAAGYATDPDYAQKLCSIISAHNLQQYDIPTSQGVTT